MKEGDYSNVRDFLGGLVGKRVLDVSQHDREEFAETRQSYIMLMFEDGITMKIPVGDEGVWFEGLGDDD